MKRSVLVPRYHCLRYDSVSMMGNLFFWLGIGAAQKGAGSKEVKPSRHPVTSFAVGTLLALLIAVGMFILLVSQQ